MAKSGRPSHPKPRRDYAGAGMSLPRTGELLPPNMPAPGIVVYLWGSLQTWAILAAPCLRCPRYRAASRVGCRALRAMKARTCVREDRRIWLAWQCRDHIRRTGGPARSSSGRGCEHAQLAVAVNAFRS
jgi:hypothetical protein